MIEITSSSSGCPSREHRRRLVRSLGHKALLACASAGLIVSGLGGGAAFGYFIGGHGTGAGTASTGSASEITVTKQDVSGLFPGGSANLVITVKNPYPSTALTVLGITAGTGSIQVTGGSGCTAANSGVSVNASATFSPSTVAAGATTAVTFTGAVRMDGTTNFSGCQGATFAVPVKVNVKVG